MAKPKFFEKRKVDEQKVEGGGGGNLPSWVLEGRLLKERAQTFLKVLKGTKDIIKKREREFIPTVLSLEINDSAIAKTHRREIRKLFKVPYDDENIIGMVGDQDLLVKFSDIRELESIINKIDNTYKYRHPISAIEEIKNFTPRVEEPEESDTSLKVKLINYHDYELNKAIRNAFEDYCDQNEIDFEKTSYSDNLVMYKINTDESVSLDSLKSFEGLLSIEPMPKYNLTLDTLAEDVQIDIKKPNEGEDYPAIGILDSGIAKVPHISPWLMSEIHTNYPENYLNRSHGTFVAGVALYGDDFHGEAYTGVEGCKILDATVIPDLKKETIDQDDLINNIREAIKDYSDTVNIWNLSIGTKVEADLNKFSDLAVALDQIQEEFDIAEKNHIKDNEGRHNVYRISDVKPRPC